MQAQRSAALLLRALAVEVRMLAKVLGLLLDAAENRNTDLELG